MQATSHTPLMYKTVHALNRRDIGPWRLWRILNGCAVAAGDLLALVVASVIVSAVGGQAPLAPIGSGWFLLIAGMWLLGASVFHLLPDWGMSPPTQLERLSKLMGVVIVTTAAAMYISHDQPLAFHLILLLSLPVALLLIVFTRSAVKSALIRMNVWGVPVAVYGGAVTGTMVIDALRVNPGYGYRPVAIFDDNPELQGTAIHGVPVAGGIASTLDVPVAILAMPGVQRQRVVEMLEGPLAPYPKVILIPDLFEVESMWARTRDFGGVMGLEVSRNLLNGPAQWIKRGLDLLLVILSAPLWLPVCALLAALIWLEDRTTPVFLQRRVGFRDVPFTAWKFRTMVPNAEAVLQQKLASDPELRAEWEANYKLRNDPRITRIGRLLRRTSLDELPQLFNVLRGDMSLVGPRPLPQYHHDQLSGQTQQLRILVHPGMTGLWQVSGRSESGNVGMERWDPYYVRNWSIWLDLYILIRTFSVVVKGSGAY
ncbi:exopolysaccharide biosynthesis polyprenyl glycosylphosphotransferase [uncultured Deinococcus sp.]|uniref:exopolysaccharide biosynthesis polyprenyl glycosylphosphotransferase n=1 Tax=Deinococcus yunweiensis TaxID=367282 RepID=UPI0025DB2FEF|nr:exopolysaccharide biosynthesis polyprenyl glycosylphosphotransferase [uncultured Deinococcus sp.]